MYYINQNIKKLYRSSYSESRNDFLRLDMNENPTGLPKAFFKEVMESITPEYVAMYPECHKLVHELSELLNCNSNNICLTNGSDDAIRLCFQVFGQEGKKLVSVSPSFEMYSVYNNMYGMKHCTAIYDENFNVDINDILNLIDDETRIVTILNPNSPIGKSWTKLEVIKIIEKARENRAIVVIDEAYHYFYPISFLEFINEYDNVMVFRTFSKLFSIAGCRIGYIVSNDKIIEMLKRASSTYPVNCFAIKFAETILQNPYIEKDLINKEKEGREYLLSQIKKENYEYHYNEANYILIKTNKKPMEIFNQLKEKGILIKIYSTPILKDWIRVTTADIENMMLFWDQFKSIDLI